MIILAACGSTSLAVDVPIFNSGFEANFAAPGAFPVFIPSGWQLYDPAQIIDQTVDAVGCLNPTAGTFFPGGPPEGSNVALIYISRDIGLGPVGLQQTLGALLSPRTRYTLTVEVGNIASGIGPPPFDYLFNLDGFPGYSVQLLAGGQVIAEDLNSLFGSIPEGEFRLSTVTFDVGDTHPLMGRPLGLRLINLNVAETPENPGIEVDFDACRLTAEPLPTCIGDYDGSGSADGDDVIAFFADWDSASLNADVNQDGGVDGDDVIVFFESWDAGC